MSWLGVPANSTPDQLAELRRLYQLIRRISDRFAEMNVGTVLQSIGQELYDAAIVHAPLPAPEERDAGPSHSEIVGLPPGDSDQAMLIGDLIAQCIVAMCLLRCAWQSLDMKIYLMEQEITMCAAIHLISPEINTRLSSLGQSSNTDRSLTYSNLKSRK